MGTKNHAKALPQLRIGPNTSSRVDNVNTVRKAIHEDIEIKCFYEGTSTLLVNTQPVQVTAGDVVVINPYEFHSTIDRGAENAPGKYHLFIVPLDFFGENCPEELDLRALCFAQKKSFQTRIADHPQLYHLLMQAAQEQETQAPGYHAAITGLMMQVFVLLLRDGLREEPSPAAPAETMRAYRLIEPALRYIRDNYNQSITIDDLAALCQISKHYFCRVFKTAMGSSAIEYLLSYRMLVSDILLVSTDKSVSQIASACGFESTQYFCRCYKRHFDISPGKRRNP